jgi:hypothetical protein
MELSVSILEIVIAIGVWWNTLLQTRWYLEFKSTHKGESSES